MLRGVVLRTSLDRLSSRSTMQTLRSLKQIQPTREKPVVDDAAEPPTPNFARHTGANPRIRHTTSRSSRKAYSTRVDRGGCDILPRSNPHRLKTSAASKTFIDLFAGCGGFSLGLLSSGWRGILAVEKHPDAFRTLRHNLIDRDEHNQSIHLYDWPQWLDKSPLSIQRFIENYRREIAEYRGLIDLIVGGPPCQGFSLAGRRQESDPRNALAEHQLTVVAIIMPKLVLLENVRGMDISFHPGENTPNQRRRGQTFASRFSESLKALGYTVNTDLVCATTYGVPQRRTRCFILGVRRDIAASLETNNLFYSLQLSRRTFLSTRGLPHDRYVTAEDAISDLKTDGANLQVCCDPESPSGYHEITYAGPLTPYQHLMNRHAGYNLNSQRLVRHRPTTIRRFSQILRTCRKGHHISKANRKRLGINKHAITPVSPAQPAPTITTLPDDLIHYSEPRIHTVREHARFQSFPDWYEFRGTYTTGGKRRRDDCPRYTQVGNAVPPLLAEAFGEVFSAAIDCIDI